VKLEGKNWQHYVGEEVHKGETWREIEGGKGI
jgi:hypothetical protein